MITARGQRAARPIRIYALLELGLAVLAVLSLWAFDLVDGFYGMAYRGAVTVAADSTGLHWLTAGGQLTLVRVLLVAVVLLPPTFLMGGTLPLFCRRFVLDGGRIIRNLGFLYGMNTLGAVLGTLVPVGVPLVMVALGSITGILQAYVFTVLASSYLGSGVES